MQQNYLLELEGKPAGRFFDFSGGTVRGEVVEEIGGSNKHIGSPRFQDMELTCGTGMSKAFYEWLGSGFSGSTLRKNGAIVLLDQKQKATARLEFSDAFVSSVVLPQLQRSANKQAFLKVSISPEYTSAKKTDTTKLGVYVSASAKAWNISSFRLKISGLEKECSQVTKINSLSLTKASKAYSAGNMRVMTKEPATSELSDLIIQLPDLHADGFYKWLDDFVIHGRNSSQFEKKGILEFFAPNSTKAYFGLEFGGLGIIGLAGASAIRTKTSTPVGVEMYCEKMRFYAGAAAIM